MRIFSPNIASVHSKSQVRHLYSRPHSIAEFGNNFQDTGAIREMNKGEKREKGWQIYFPNKIKDF